MSAFKLKDLPEYPDFTFKFEEVDGLVPSCRVSDWKQFFRSLDEVGDSSGEEMIYRGHRRYDWQLESTLERQFDGGSIPEAISEELLNRFRLAMRGRGHDLSNKENNEIWAFGQHFGLSTPLLDWTGSPYVALFFAFWKADNEFETSNPSRAVFRINRTLLSEVLSELFFEPTLGENARLVNQAGLFTVTPEGEDTLVSAILNALAERGAIDPDEPDEVARYICKFHIPNTDRISCLNSLRRMNIHNANLFPDPTGASEYCNDWLARAVREERNRRTAAELIESRGPKKSFETASSIVVAMPEGEPKEVAAILAYYLPDETQSLPLEGWAEKIAETYRTAYSLDWPNHESAVARVRLSFRKLLSALGYPEAGREKAVQGLIEHYKEGYSKFEGVS